MKEELFFETGSMQLALRFFDLVAFLFWCELHKRLRLTELLLLLHSMSQCWSWIDKF